eukprot:5090203-Lingulodinium_polyedra.AAC.1
MITNFNDEINQQAIEEACVAGRYTELPAPLRLADACPYPYTMQIIVAPTDGEKPRVCAKH